MFWVSYHLICEIVWTFCWTVTVAEVISRRIEFSRCRFITDTVYLRRDRLFAGTSSSGLGLVLCSPTEMISRRHVVVVIWTWSRLECDKRWLTPRTNPPLMHYLERNRNQPFNINVEMPAAICFRSSWLSVGFSAKFSKETRDIMAKYFSKRNILILLVSKCNKNNSGNSSSTTNSIKMQ